MDTQKYTLEIQIRMADEKDLFDLLLCGKEFIDFIENFKNKFKNKEFFVLTAYYNKILAGLLIAEDKTHKIDSIEKIIPCMLLHLLYVNPEFRNKNIGKYLLQSFISTQRQNGLASIHILLPQKYRSGIEFFLKNNFQIINKVKNRIVLEIPLWNDYGVRECQIIGDNFNDMFY